MSKSLLSGGPTTPGVNTVNVPKSTNQMVVGVLMGAYCCRLGVASSWCKPASMLFVLIWHNTDTSRTWGRENSTKWPSCCDWELNPCTQAGQCCPCSPRERSGNDHGLLLTHWSWDWENCGESTRQTMTCADWKYHSCTEARQHCPCSLEENWKQSWVALTH